MVVFGKWSNGSDKALMKAALQGWCRFIQTSKDADKRKAVMKEMMVQWFEGETKGLVVSVFRAWQAEFKQSSAVNAHRAAVEAQEKQKRERAKESVRLMVRKWELGQSSGLLSAVFSAWRAFGAKRASVNRSKAS